MVNLHLGQNWDIHWHNGQGQPTVPRYLDMITNKTSVLPRMNLELLSLVTKMKKF
jgi:geranylgeranyl pyrophosphate synthase